MAGDGAVTAVTAVTMGCCTDVEAGIGLAVIIAAGEVVKGPPACGAPGLLVVMPDTTPPGMHKVLVARVGLGSQSAAMMDPKRKCWITGNL